MDEQNRCRACGKERPADAPLGLCPLCLLRAGQAAEPAAPADQDPCELVSLGQASPSVLSTLARSLGKLPRVLLRDVELANGPATRSGRLELFGPIGRGGMGVVLKGRDTDLGRDLAVKVLLEQFQDNPAMVRRFIEEAQIGGQLQHPGVVPVYELGTLSDRRPYIAMKLIKGLTLAELLYGRGTLADDRPRLLGILEAVCQTMAFAHSKGVIHRDLKPSNIMVGSYGEVQVMDWGVAKVLASRGEVDDVTTGSDEMLGTKIATGRSCSQSELSSPGSVIGTPAYMAPEQARGEVDVLDERADVFALGSILCEVLTGEPAFIGRSSIEIERLAARGEVAPAHARLDASGADLELVELAKECLSARPAERPRDARVLAERVTSYRTGVQEKLHEAELAAVEAHARAQEEAKRRGLADQLAAEAVARAADERRRRRLMTALAASVLALVVSGGGAAAWFMHERQAMLQRVSLVLNEAELLRKQAADDPAGDVGKWQAARAAARHARELMEAIPAATIRGRLGELEKEIDRGAAAALQDRELVARLEQIRGGLDADARADAAYAEAFRAAGVDLMSTTSDFVAAGRRLAARPRSVAQAAAAALGAWAVVRGSLIRQGDQDGEARLRKLLETARAADPDPWRDALRDALERRDIEGYRRLALDGGPSQQGPVSLWLLGFALEQHGDHNRALEFLKRAQQTYPGDYWLNVELGLALLEGKRSGPGTTHSVVTASLGDRETNYQMAEPYLMAAVALRPRFAGAHHLLGVSYHHQGKSDDAITELREAIRLQPDDATIRNSLANAFLSHGKLDLAIAEYREAIRLAPRYNLPHLNLGDLLITRQGKVAEAINHYHEAVRLEPEYDPAHVHLGYALQCLGKLDDAIAEYRVAIRLNPDGFLAHANLGDALSMQGDFAQAAVELEKALDLTTVPQRRENLKQRLAVIQHSRDLAKRLPEVLRGTLLPRDPAEALEFAYLLQQQRWFAASTRLFAQAMTVDPKLVGDMKTPNRYNAACAAALAASGQGNDQPPIDDEVKTRMRRLAYDWLKEDLALWSKILRSGPPQDRAMIQATLEHWKADPDLVQIRAALALAKFPEPERKEWQGLWAEVDALLGK
jgi:tetratricopeptide (TPR) repeat protein